MEGSLKFIDVIYLVFLLIFVLLADDGHNMVSKESITNAFGL